MNEKLSIILIVITLLIAEPIHTQTGTSLHSHTPASMVDGAVSPENIPDKTAYRLWLVMVSRPSNATREEMDHQASHLGKIGLEEKDRQVLISILANFNSAYQNLIQSYNEAATVAWAKGEVADLASFYLQRDRLVQSTREAIRSGLSLDGVVRLDAHVQSEKKRMKVSLMEVEK